MPKLNTVKANKQRIKDYAVSVQKRVTTGKALRKSIAKVIAYDLAKLKVNRATKLSLIKRIGKQVFKQADNHDTLFKNYLAHVYRRATTGNRLKENIEAVIASDISKLRKPDTSDGRS